MRLTAMTCSARLSCRSPSRLGRRRPVRPDDTGTGAVPDGMLKAAWLRIRPGAGPRQQDLRSGERAQAVFGCDQAGSHVFDEDGDLGFGAIGELGEDDGALAQADQGLAGRTVRRSAPCGQASWPQVWARRSAGIRRSWSRGTAGR